MHIVKQIGNDFSKFNFDFPLHGASPQRQMQDYMCHYIKQKKKH